MGLHQVKGVFSKIVKKYTMFELLGLYIAICILWIGYLKNPPKDRILTILPLIAAAAAVPAVFQGIKGLRQRRLAKKLKESTFVPSEMRENQDLARQQAYSRRAPGAARAEENIRKNLATTLGSQSRMFGGDAGKMVALSSGASARADNAAQGVQAQGQAFSENAFGRLAGANNAVAGQKRQNRDEYNRTKAQLLAASDQNIFNSISNLSTAGLTAMASGGGKGSNFAQGMLSAQNPFMNMGGYGGYNEYDPDAGTYYENPASKWRQKQALRRLQLSN